MASAVVTALISTSLLPMLAKAKNIIENKGLDKAMDIIIDKGQAIVRSMADKAMDEPMDKVVDKIEKTLRMIKSIVRVAEEKQIDDDFIRNWLHDLVDIAYEARDVLDDFITFSSCVITAYEEASNPVNFISSFIMKYVGGSSSDTSNIPLAILNRLAKDIRSVAERFHEKKKEWSDFMTSIGSVIVGGGSESVKNRRPEVGPSINRQSDALFLGREDVKKGIMDKILEPKYDRVDVVVIWGMGGIGKTTLALSIYNNDEIVKKVPRSWLSVGVNKFSAEKVIREIVNDQNSTGNGNLQTKLKEKLRGDRFLIVLDDVWDVDGSQWGLLFNPLTEVGKGGMIIITRRERQLCAAITIQTAYNLPPLSEEDSWSIFESCAYDTKPDPKGIGEEIVKKLNGHPLALKVVGRSLLNKDYSTWKNFLESKFSEDDEVMSALRWSYNHLLSHLKMCFTYCNLFPKGHVLDKKVLVQMWMAHDLIEKKEQERPEDVGAQYFEQLVNASLLQCVDGKYVMHDLIHDLAQLVSNGEFATANGSLTNDQMKKVRHITITEYDYSKIPRLCKIEKLVTLYTTRNQIYTTTKFDYSVLDDVFKQLKSLRVLVLVSSKITDIPDCISELRHLRYLDVSETDVQSLPYSLCRLYNLQMIAAHSKYLHTIIFNRVKLPIDIVNISSLRYIRGNLSTCKGVGKLTSLQELSSIRVCQGDNIRELGDMQRLRGKFTIKGLENVKKLEGDVGALMEKQTLMDELELEFCHHFQKSTISAQVLDALGCPPNLTYLQIFRYAGLKPPSWMVDGKHKFDKLQTLNLLDCPKLESLPPLGELTSLKDLYLEKVGVKRLGDEFYGKFTDGKVFFPSLESLLFSSMREWREWDDIIIENSNVSFFPRLTKLVIKECVKLVSVLPVVKNPIMNAANFMKSLSRLEIGYCEGLKRLQLDALVSLKELNIHSCPQLQSLNFHKLSSLKSLTINDCPQLQSLPPDFHKLSSLQKLNINRCPQLQSLPPDFHKLSSLKDLYIYDCPQLQSLPPDFHKLSSLKDLIINDCPQLQSLPRDFHKLSSLERLFIKDCSQLQSLPAYDFPPSLGYLGIFGCPLLLYEHCKDESDLD